MTDTERMQSFPDQSHWRDMTLHGRPIPEYLHAELSYWDTDQGSAERRPRSGPPYMKET